MIVDVHSHIGRLGSDYATMQRRESVDSTALVRNMDKLGIEKSCVLPLCDCPEGWYLKNTTEDVITACSEYPDRLIPFCLIDPRFGDNSPKSDLSELFTEYKERGCRGLGELIAKIEFDDPRAINLYDHAGKAGFPVLFDMNIASFYGVLDDPGMPRLENALRQCPHTIFIGHGPTFWAEISGEDIRIGYPKGPVKPKGAVPRLMERYDNLWADLSAGSAYNALTRDRKYGLEFIDRFHYKLLFGTDLTKRDEDAPIIHYFRKIHSEHSLSEPKCKAILRENAIRLLNI